MNEELTQSDLKAIHRAMSAASRMDRLNKISRIGWTIALASAFGIVLLAFVLRQVQPSKPDIMLDNRAYTCITCPQPAPSPTPVDTFGSEPTLGLVVSAHPEGLVEKIVAAARLCGVPPGIAIRLVARESGFRQFDSRGNVLRSKAGALGLTQVKRSSAAEISPTLNIETEWGNLLAGLCYASKQKGDMKRKLLAYRDGPNHRGAHSKAAHAYVADILEAQ